MSYSEDTVALNINSDWSLSNRWAKIKATDNVALKVTPTKFPAAGTLFFFQDETGGKTLSVNGKPVVVNPTPKKLTVVSVVAHTLDPEMLLVFSEVTPYNGNDDQLESDDTETYLKSLPGVEDPAKTIVKKEIAPDGTVSFYWGSYEVTEVPSILTDVDVFFIDGQSNALGTGNMNDFGKEPLIIAPDPKRVYSRAKIWNPKDGAATFQNLQGGVNNLSANDGTVTKAAPYSFPSFGAEIGLAQRYEAENPGKTYYIIKKTADGDPIEVWADGQTHWLDFVNNYLNPALAYFKANNLNPVVKGWYWMQGESNAGDTGYTEKLEDLDSRLTAVGALQANTIRVIGGVRNSAQMQAEQLAYVNANPTKRKFINTNGYSVIADGIHYDSKSCYSEGHRDVYNAIFGTAGGYALPNSLIFEENNPNLVYSGDWKTVTFEPGEQYAFSGSGKYLLNTPGYVEFTFTGSRFDYYVSNNPTWNQVFNVIVDNVFVETVSIPKGPLEPNTIKYSKTSPQGTHTVRLQHAEGQYNTSNIMFFDKVVCSNATTQLLFDGDSLSTAIAEPYPYSEKVRVGLSNQYFDYRTFGVGGQTMLQMLSDAKTQIDSLLDSTKTHNVVVVWGGINDVGQHYPIDDIQRAIVQYHNDRINAGFITIALTLTPARGPAYPEYWDEYEAKRLAINEWMRANQSIIGYSALADVASDDRIGDFEDAINSTYFIDGVHFSGAGNQIIAEYVIEAIKGLPHVNPYPNGILDTGNGLSVINLLKNTEAFDQTGGAGEWVKNGINILANSLVAPNGDETADKFIETATNEPHRAYQIVPYTNGSGEFTFSIHLKAAERNRALVSFSDGVTGDASAVFDLANGTFNTATGLATGDFTNITAGLEALPDGGYRCRVSALKGNLGNSIVCAVSMVNTGVNYNYTGITNHGLYVWKAQLESGLEAKPYKRPSL